MQDYFALFGLEPAFELDLAALKKQFYQLSRSLHPDQATGEEQMQQAAGLNKAYEVLRHFDSRLQHWLELRGAMPAEGAYKMPASFLEEMMDINERIMELGMDYDAAAHHTLREEIAGIQAEWKKAFTEQVAGSQSDAKEIEEAARKYFFQQRYLLRILENLDKFADP